MTPQERTAKETARQKRIKELGKERKRRYRLRKKQKQQKQTSLQGSPSKAGGSLDSQPMRKGHDRASCKSGGSSPSSSCQGRLKYLDDMNSDHSRGSQKVVQKSEVITGLNIFINFVHL